MNHKEFILFILLSSMIAIQLHADDQCIQTNNNNAFVYLTPAVRTAFVALEQTVPNYAWSITFRSLCKDIREQANVTTHKLITGILNECLAALAHDEQNDTLPYLKSTIQEYRTALTSGDAFLSAEDAATMFEGNQPITRSKCKSKTFCKLCVSCLTVTGTLTVKGAIVGPNGPIGVGLSAYGYIYDTTTQTVALEAAVTFNSNGPLLGITHTPGSSAITITNAGTYEVSYTANGNDGGQAQWTIFVNGAPNPSTTYNTGDLITNGFAALTLSAGDVLTLVNHTSDNANTLIAGNQPGVTASVLIERIA